MDNDILSKMGFERLSNKDYSGSCGDINILLEVEDGIFKFTVPCASSMVDNERILDGFVKERAARHSFILAEYKERVLKIIYKLSDDGEKEEAVRNVFDIMEAMHREFDILPVCMRCKRAAPSRVVYSDNKLYTICGICDDESRFKQKIQRYDEYTKMKREGGTSKMSYIRLGAIAGLIACVAGLLLTIFDKVMPSSVTMVWLSGALAGHMIMSIPRKANYSLGVEGVIISSMTALLIMIAISFINVYAVDLVFEIVPFGIYGASEKLSTITGLAIINLSFGLGSFFAVQAIEGLWWTGHN